MPSIVFASLIWRENGHLANLPGGVLLVSMMIAHFFLSCPAKTLSLVFSAIIFARLITKLSVLSGQ